MTPTSRAPPEPSLADPVAMVLLRVLRRLLARVFRAPPRRYSEHEVAMLRLRAKARL